MAKFRVLHITSNITEYPQAIKDSDEFSHIVGWLDDEHEYGIFILDEERGSIFPAEDFFHMFEADEITTFSTDTQDLEDELFVATNFIRSIRTQCGHAKTPKDEHMACWAAVKESPLLTGNRVELTDKDRTFIELKRTKS